ncbi:MAG: hypothetical protein R2911_31070 [Caldilineaceae bacterium]
MGTAVVSGAMSQEYVADRAFRTLYAPLAGSYFLSMCSRVASLPWDGMWKNSPPICATRC